MHTCTGPLGTPQSLTASPYSTNVTIQWGRVNCLDRNSEIIGYTVHYGRSTTNERITAIAHGTEERERMFTARRLSPCTNYTFEVTALNKYGEDGLQRANVTTRTLPPESE